MPEPPTPNLYRRLIQLIPSLCIICGKPSRAASSLCLACEIELPWAERCCKRCAQEMPGTISDSRLCAQCRLRPPPFASCTAIFRYESPINGLLSGFKFKARFEAGYVLAALLAEKITQRYEDSLAPELLLPVPLHPRRLRQRGFNQALEITKVVSQQCQIPLCRNAIVKIRDTVAQTELHSAKSRKENLKNAFRVADKLNLRRVRSVAVIDDVITTMATVTAVCQELQRFGIRHIDVWCLARASR